MQHHHGIDAAILGNRDLRVTGPNEFVRYADVEAIRVLCPGPLGLEGLMEQAWARYGLPMAITETHNGCTREEQMRWTVESWRTAQALRSRGAEVEAVTAWALLGSFDWNSLLTRDEHHYETGAFDLRGGQVRPTAVTDMLVGLSSGGDLHPVLSGPGWWRRDVRLEFQPVLRTAETMPPRRAWKPVSAPHRPLLIAGATGTLGQALARACEWRGLSYVLTSRDQLELCDPESVDRALELHDPWAVINATGWVRVDDAETEQDACMQANSLGAVLLARACEDRGVHHTFFSSDLVFDGEKDRPYVESDPQRPLSVYGRSKAEAEGEILEQGERALVIRTAAFFSPDDRYNFAHWVSRELGAGRAVRAASDSTASPTYVPDLAQAVLDLVVDGERGVWHLTNNEPLTWAEFARAVARSLELDPRLVRSTPMARMGWAARRQRYAPLTSERAVLLPSFDSALARYARAVREGVDSFEVEAERRREASVGSVIGCVA